MTGTNCDLFTHKSSRSYLNHLLHTHKHHRVPLPHYQLFLLTFYNETLYRMSWRSDINIKLLLVFLPTAMKPSHLKKFFTQQTPSGSFQYECLSKTKQSALLCARATAFKTFSYQKTLDKDCEILNLSNHPLPVLNLLVSSALPHFTHSTLD